MSMTDEEMKHFKEDLAKSEGLDPDAIAIFEVEPMNDNGFRKCPFCGGKDIWYGYHGEVDANLEPCRVGYVECRTCGARTVGLNVTVGNEESDEYTDQTGFRVAKYLWNRRA